MNEMTLVFKSRLENEAFARTSAIAFLMPLNLNMDEIMEIKTLLAEGIVNAMIHGYEGNSEGEITLYISYDETNIYIEISDKGCGIEDIDLAMQPLYTTKEHLERSGMGLTIMKTFADEFKVVSKAGEGTTISLLKKLDNETGTNK